MDHIIIVREEYQVYISALIRTLYLRNDIGNTEINTPLNPTSETTNETIWDIENQEDPLNIV